MASPWTAEMQSWKRSPEMKSGNCKMVMMDWLPCGWQSHGEQEGVDVSVAVIEENEPEETTVE